MKSTDVDMAVSKAASVFNSPQFGQTGRHRGIAKESKAAGNNEGGHVADTFPAPDRILLNKLEGANDQAQSVAQQIRAVDHTMNLIEEKVDQMRAALEGLVKVYPPYPQDSNERVQALRQFAALRKLIDQLTVPPPDDSTVKILGDHESYSEAGDWELSLGKGRQALTIGRQPIHSGPGGLDLPEFPSDASDEDLNQGLNRIIKAGKTLQNRREGFVADANRVIAAIQ